MSEPNNNNNNQQQNTQQQSQQQQSSNSQQTTQQAPPAFDYDKLASLITGKQTVTEDTVLKSYFKQQGLSEDEMKQAISSFKEQKAKNTPDVEQLQSTINSERNARLLAEVNQSATLEAIKQGVDVKSIPYVLKMADFSKVSDENGKINADKLTGSIKKVLEDVPALKATSSNDNGFGKIGGDGNNNQSATEDTLRNIFGIKK